MSLPYDRLVDWVFPPPAGCILCRRRLPGLMVCNICRHLYENRNSCPQCGRDGWPGRRCPECRQAAFAFREGSAAGILQGLLHQRILDFKYRNRADFAGPLAKWMVSVTHLPKPDWVCYVPADRSRIRQRGYNPAELLARKVADLLDVGCRDMLRRTPGSGKQQNAADFGQRWRQVQEHFHFAGDTRVHGQTVWLIDDVITTGATLSVCACALLRAGIKAVDVLVAATTPKIAFHAGQEPVRMEWTSSEFF